MEKRRNSRAGVKEARGGACYQTPKDHACRPVDSISPSRFLAFLLVKSTISSTTQLAISINTLVSSCVTNSFIATNMFSELVGLTYNHKEIFFVTLWMSKICEHCFVARFCYRAFFFMISNKISWKITSLYRKPTMAIKRYLSYPTTDAVK